ncbi:hypothetical protein [Cerasicoccus arenae]|uniref:Uncharacterized protein n=1 Tax=Cerasicoccus arenae TaxID=424488 RepID=A0A8J3DG83_9BACT|nr:hypothetical protein [Cerasicoccus arenae]MBK1859063.1 hypothetical protein [Cerasicoccus arenae]GHC03429.1 hypothetical protein GCM10007047_20020 [Cerasicoccus arenae]
MPSILTHVDKKKSIWRKDRLANRWFGRIFLPVFLLVAGVFVIWQAISGLFFGKAIMLWRLGGPHHFTGVNATLIGLAYLCVVLFFGSFMLKSQIQRLRLEMFHKLFLVAVALIFLISLGGGIYREAF